MLIQSAQSEGLSVTSDVAIHQLFFDENSIDNFNSDFHVMPPFRSNEDLVALHQAVNKETITAICSDHQPHNEDAKQAPFSDTQPGISSIELLLPLIMELVELKIIDMSEAIAKVTSNPSEILGIDAGVIAKGLPADLCIIKKEAWLFDEAKILSAGKNNPFLGRKFNYSVDKTICDGKIVYEKK